MTARLIYADSEQSADMFYVTGIFIPDAFLFLQLPNGERHLLVSALEVDRARRLAKVQQVHIWHEWQARLVAEQQADQSLAPPLASEVIAFFLREHGVTRVIVPGEFPLLIGDALRLAGIQITAQDSPFWPERAFKRPDEIVAIEAALQITGQGIQAGIERIRAATIDGHGALWWDGVPLTSEVVRQAIHLSLVASGAMPHHTIVAGGPQGADPHEVGSGPLFAGQPIIIDCFPRISATGYWGDMTRTVCRGEAPPRLRAMWEAVQQAQELAMRQIRPQVAGLTIHQSLVDFFADKGFHTGETEEGRQCGFFHGTGHGLGLEVHEPPRIGRSDQPLLAGYVVTVEPGLYYPDLGGVRLEDVVVITDEGCRNLTDFPKFLEI